MRSLRDAVRAVGGRLRGRLLAIPLVRFGVTLVRQVGDDDLTGMAAEMAYSFLFALFPLLLLSAAIIGMVGSVLGRTGPANGSYHVLMRSGT